MIGPRRYIFFPYVRPRNELDLRLEAGLDVLSSLKRLEIFDFRGLWQQMEEQDVRWMAEALPNLTVVKGDLHHSYEREVALSLILNEKVNDRHRISHMF